MHDNINVITKKVLYDSYHIMLLQGVEYAEIQI